MKKITNRWKLLLYGCSGLGVNMLNLIVGSYLCSALLTGGFEDNVESWTYINKDLVIAGLWAVMVLVAKIVDGIIDIPLSHFTDNLNSKWGKRKTALVIGYVPMIISFLLFLIPLTRGESIGNTLWFAGLLLVFYAFYTLTMLTYYATFSEVTKTQEDIVFLSNVKSVCDVVYFIFGYALVPAFVSMQFNIRVVALMFLPLSLTMMIPLFMLKENCEAEETEALEKTAPAPRTTLKNSILFTVKDKPFVLWMCIVFVMNVGLQLFLSGINEFFSTTGINMTFVMGSSFAPVPFTILLYNKIVNKKGLGFGYRYILLVFSIGMALMSLCNIIPQKFLYPMAIGCGIIVSFAIGAFFSITYTVPSQRATLRQEENASAPSMYFAIQGLFEGTSAGFGTGVILVYLKDSGNVKFITLIVAALCMAAFVMSFLLPKTITQIGKVEAVKTSGGNEE